MSTLIFVALFLAPGLVTRQIHKFVTKRREGKIETYDLLAKVVAEGIIITVMTAIIIKQIDGPRMETIDDLIVYVSRFDGMVKYILVMAPLTIVYYVIVRWIGKKVIIKIKNVFLKKTYYYEHEEGLTPFFSVLNEKEIIGSWLVVSIYHYDTYITSGIIDTYSLPVNETFELVMSHNEKTEKLIEEKPEWLKTEYDYINTNTGLRIVFYMQKPIMEHWETYFPEITS